MISTRKKIIVIADQLIRSKGYNAFSYADIAATLKIKNAAIHYHFPSKVHLGNAVIDETKEKFDQNTATWNELNSLEKMEQFIEMYTKNEKNNCICFMGAFGSDINTLPEKMQLNLKDAYGAINNWLMQTLKQGKSDGTFHFMESVTDMTHSITSSLLASLILQRVSNEPMLEQVSETILKRLEKKTK